MELCLKAMNEEGAHPPLSIGFLEQVKPLREIPAHGG